MFGVRAHRRYRGFFGVGIKGDIGDVWGQCYRAHRRYRGCFGVRVIGHKGDIGDVWG